MRWTNKDEERLKELFPAMTLEELAREFDRSARAIHSRVGKLKLRKTKDWSAIARNYKPVIFRGQA